MHAEYNITTSILLNKLAYHKTSQQFQKTHIREKEMINWLGETLIVLP